MKKLTLVLPLLVLMGCGVSTYRDAIATSYGYLFWSQTTYKAQCHMLEVEKRCGFYRRELRRIIGETFTKGEPA